MSVYSAIDCSWASNLLYTSAGLLDYGRPSSARIANWGLVLECHELELVADSDVVSTLPA